MLRLRDLGHPLYLEKTDTIQCDDKLEDAKKKVWVCVCVYNV